MNNSTPEERARALELAPAQLRAWLAVEAHVLASHTCRPVWRPTTAEEIQPGWEVRSRDHLGAEATWGVAHLQTDEGGWLTESGSLLSCRGDGWAYETTAPLPEPVPDPRVDLLEGVCLREGVVLTRSDVALILSIADAVEPSKAES